MKKTLSLLLVVVMMLSVMVIPAAAAAARYFNCPTCLVYCPATKVSETSEIVTVNGCNENSSIHNHYKYYDVYAVNCVECGTSLKNVYTHYVCP